MEAHGRAVAVAAMWLVLTMVTTCGAARVHSGHELGEKGVIASQGETPVATPWPEEFTVAFTTDGGKAPGRIFYDWGGKQQAILHSQGSSHCRARGSAGACYVLENARGTFEVDPVARRCEVTSPWGSVKPAWVVPGVFAGVEVVNGVRCNRFDYPPSPHSWLEAVDGGAFCAFLFPSPAFTFVFAPTSLKLGPPPAHVFAVPNYCPNGTSRAPLKATL